MGEREEMNQFVAKKKTESLEDEEMNLSFLNQPELYVVKNRKRKHKKHEWVVPLNY
jgi:hypothetical protein